MLRKLLLAVCLSASFGMCETVCFAQLPPPVYADTEVSTNCPLTAWTEKTGRFEIALSFAASPSNNVQLAFGRDRDGDGVLALDETELVLGWDCGQWFVRLLSPEWEEYAEDAAAGNKSFRLAADLSRPGTFRSLSLLDGNAPVLATLPEAARNRLYSREWNRMRFTARGIDRPRENLAVKLTENGMVFLLR